MPDNRKTVNRGPVKLNLVTGIIRKVIIAEITKFIRLVITSNSKTDTKVQLFGTCKPVPSRVHAHCGCALTFLTKKN